MASHFPFSPSPLPCPTPSFSWNAGWGESQTSQGRLESSIANGILGTDPHCLGILKRLSKPSPAGWKRLPGGKDAQETGGGVGSSAGDKEVQGTQEGCVVPAHRRKGTWKERCVLPLVIGWSMDLMRAIWRQGGQLGGCHHHPGEANGSVYLVSGCRDGRPGEGCEAHSGGCDPETDLERMEVGQLVGFQPWDIFQVWPELGK